MDMAILTIPIAIALIISCGDGNASSTAKAKPKATARGVNMAKLLRNFQSLCTNTRLASGLKRRRRGVHLKRIEGALDALCARGARKKSSRPSSKMARVRCAKRRRARIMAACAKARRRAERQQRQWPSCQGECHETCILLRHVRDQLAAEKNKASALQAKLTQCRAAVSNYEEKLSELRQHQKGCVHKGIAREAGERWTNETACVECTCSRGSAHCGPIGCAPLPCAHPVDADGCCPVCSAQCYWNGGVYEHGQVFYPKICTRCECDDGKVSCAHVHPADCPTLTCPEHQRRILAGVCCPVCTDHDHCQEQSCHVNATCVNEQHGWRCTCKPGFYGDGDRCYDIDECKSPPANVDSCDVENSRCVNKVGSYECHCLPGYGQVDKVTCGAPLCPP